MDPYINSGGLNPSLVGQTAAAVMDKTARAHRLSGAHNGVGEERCGVGEERCGVGEERVTFSV